VQFIRIPHKHLIAIAALQLFEFAERVRRSLRVVAGAVSIRLVARAAREQPLIAASSTHQPVHSPQSKGLVATPALAAGFLRT
jgi:hypothetical protein